MKTKKLILFLMTISIILNLNAQHIGSGLGIHSIAVKNNGAVYTWGFNRYGQLGNGNTTNSNVPVAVNTSGVLSGKIITQVATGYYHSIGLSLDGNVYSWGDNSAGQLGNGTFTGNNVPVAVSTAGVLSGKIITQIAAGGFHSIALASDGKVYTWGGNHIGQLGTGNTINSNVPVAVDTSGVLSGKIITQIASGYGHSMALASDGKVYTWGLNSSGQLGNYTYTDSKVPVSIKTSGVLSGKTIVQIAAGSDHSIALASDGTVYTWGRNDYGQLGNGSFIGSITEPVAVNTSGVLSGKTIIQIAAGYYHSIALASDGTVYTWGDNTYGQLGNGNNTKSNVPVTVRTVGVLNGKTIVNIASGSDHSIALASDGTLYTWGRNSSGQLGNGSSTDSNVPVAVDQSGMGLLTFMEDGKLPAVFSLNQNYPNPFNPSTTFEFTIPEDGLTTLKIYDLLGQEIQTIVNEELKSGAYKFNWKASGFPSGIYFYILTFTGTNSNFNSTKKMVYLR